MALNRNIVSEQKYEDLKKAVSLLENVFSGQEWLFLELISNITPIPFRS